MAAAAGAHGHSRDGKPRNRQVLVGVVMVDSGRIAHHVFSRQPARYHHRDGGPGRSGPALWPAAGRLRRRPRHGDGRQSDPLRNHGQGYLVGLHRRRREDVARYLERATGPWTVSGRARRRGRTPVPEDARAGGARRRAGRPHLRRPQRRAARLRAGAAPQGDGPRARQLEGARAARGGRQADRPAQIGAAAARILSALARLPLLRLGLHRRALPLLRAPRQSPAGASLRRQVRHPDRRAAPHAGRGGDRSTKSSARSSAPSPISRTSSRLRPIYHRTDRACEAHIFVAALAFLLHRASRRN